MRAAVRVCAGLRSKQGPGRKEQDRGLLSVETRNVVLGAAYVAHESVCKVH